MVNPQINMIRMVPVSFNFNNESRIYSGENIKLERNKILLTKGCPEMDGNSDSAPGHAKLRGSRDS